MPVATPITGGRRPIQVRADVLRQWSASFDARQGFALMPQDAGADLEASCAQSETGWRDADLKRAIAAAKEAGLQCYRVELAPDGTISVIVGGTPETAGDAAPD
jgi:hypothetical protein